MSAPRLAAAPPGPRASGVFYLLFAVDVVAALWCATQAMACAWSYHPALGAPLVRPTPAATRASMAGAVLLVGSALTLLVVRPRGWRVSLAGLTAAGVLVMLASGPIYAPQQGLVWAVRYRRMPAAELGLARGHLTFGGALLLAVCVTQLLRTGRRARAPSDAHGTARWGTGEGLHRADGVVVGRLHGRLLRYGGDGHLITVAPTRAGKGVGVVIPNLLTYPGSMIVTDPKAENYLVTARRRRALHSKVYAFDPFDLAHAPEGTATFNPLSLIDATSPDAVDDVRMLADMLVVIEGKETGEQAFWNEEARAVLAGIMLHVVTSAAPEDRHLARVRELLTLPPEEFAVLLTEMSANPEANGVVSRAAARLLQKAEKERSGVVSSAQAHTHFLDSPRMVEVLSASSVDLAALVRERVTYYFILPPDRLATYQRWLRLMIGCCLIVLTRHVGRRDVPRAPHRVRIVLDEFGHLGRMPPVEHGIGLVGGYGASFWLLLQDLAQLKAIYPERWGSFIANADVLQAFGINDWETAEYLSKMTGEATIPVASDNVSRGISYGKSGGRQESAAQTVSETKRRLLFPDEVRRLPRTKQLLFVRGSDPLCADVLSYLHDPEFTGYDPNPLAP